MVFYRGGGKSVLLESFLILIFLLALYSSTFLKLFFLCFCVANVVYLAIS